MGRTRRQERGYLGRRWEVSGKDGEATREPEGRREERIAHRREQPISMNNSMCGPLTGLLLASAGGGQQEYFPKGRFARLDIINRISVLAQGVMHANPKNISAELAGWSDCNWETHPFEFSF